MAKHRSGKVAFRSRLNWDTEVKWVAGKESKLALKGGSLKEHVFALGAFPP
jgi:hypothetical protein